MKKEKAKLFHGNVPVFSGITYLERFSEFNVFLVLFLFLIAGVLFGSFISIHTGILEGRMLNPLLFSGIPSPELGFISCFTTLLINVLICLIILFLFGVTAFGVFAVPVFTLLRGAAIGIGVLSFIYTEGLSGFGHSALYYIPATAANSLLLLLFAVRALIFSDRLTKLSIYAQQGSLDFKVYFVDFLVFLALAAAVSLAGCIPALLYAVFLQ